MNLGEIGKRVRLRRVELGLTQEALATRAKVGLGTVQALEDAQHRDRPRQTLPSNLQKIAKALNCSLESLTKDRDIVDERDPLLVGLNHEDVLIARAYHDAPTVMRQRVHVLLHDGEPARITAILEDLRQFSSDDLNVIEASITALKLAHQNSQTKVQRQP